MSSAIPTETGRGQQGGPRRWFTLAVGIIGAGALLLAACSSGSDDDSASSAADTTESAPTTVAAVETTPPATDPPATDPPVTEPPATDPPVTEPPATEPPVTEPPATAEQSTTPVAAAAEIADEIATSFTARDFVTIERRLGQDGTWIAINGQVYDSATVTAFLEGFDFIQTIERTDQSVQGPDGVAFEMSETFDGGGEGTFWLVVSYDEAGALVITELKEAPQW